ncbi:hypothetical protein BBO99_00001206 [Phytophthora kernoviae]|uniref:trehalose-phosphatase n=2 Tax=Phytophthora kernoviae TaxID=325452 RepID=A0A3R7JXZ7_9STRA|nr:hypothetical protein G195_002966 [Phytophthora kernoviae 00238/432]KAG2526280.1 hypothetical protein JM16_002074 [Phytophthora kernoviae]KAG2527821.1 hypothetical protein JM18_002179 [Phytophthora kernoviae]RLN32240.1 hypothetical protein BBI17_004350 [Phytophthora kernoviae]RLN84598.1 hypothetical protein BBO99_00001206 [Phytophthora kernoviae]
MATTTTTTAGTELLATTTVNEHPRPSRRLSVTNANALANFSVLQARFRDHRLVVFLDYDGTLTPIVNDPALALLSPAMKDTLEKLREKFITGVITGRSLHKIQKFVSIPQLYYAGSHGFDIEGPNGTAIKNQVAAQFLTDLHNVRDELSEKIKDVPGAEVEDNIFSVSLHYRNVESTLRPQISALARTTGDQHPRIKLNQGKMVYEFKPKIDWNKGKALEWLLQALGLHEHDDVYTIYIGDDTTDEDAFQLFQAKCNLKGVGIVVTEESVSTDASFTLRDTNELLGVDVQHREFITLRWQDECQHETGQRNINSFEIDPENLDIEKIFVKGDTLNIVWDDHHESSFPTKWLVENSYSQWALNQYAHDMTPIPLPLDAPVPTTEYARMMDKDDEKGLYEALQQVVENGFTVIQSTPSEPGAVKTLAERISPISHSFQYGDVFDVVAEPKPVNIAYTTVYLKSHVDLAYYESPPGLQFLHALHFDESVQGGESTFVDVFSIADEFRRSHPEHFATFCRVPATFMKRHLTREKATIMEYQRPHIQLNHRDEVIAVHWSPPFEGPLKVPFDDVMPYYDAYRIFHELVEGGKHRYEFKLKQGDTVIFNQRRVLHGRKQFSQSSNGVRHLQGTYINIDDALCRYNVLRTRFAANDPTAKNRRVANGNFA